MTENRHVPANEEAEICVLSAILVDRDGTADDVFELLKPDDFYRAAHRDVFAAMVKLHEAGKPTADPVIVGTQLTDDGKLDGVGGLEYLARLLDAGEVPGNATYYAEMIRQRSVARRILAAAHQIGQVAREAKLDSESMAAAAEQAVLEATDRATVTAPKQVKERVWPVLEEIERRTKTGITTGIPTHLTELDLLVGGWHPGQLIYVAARPSEGKSAVALWCSQAAAAAGIPTLFCSLEMTNDELIERLLACHSGIDSWRLARGQLSDADFPALSKGAGKIGGMPLYIDDTPARSIGTILSLSRRYRRQHGIGLVVVDYVQLVTCDTHADTRNDEVGVISRGLKRLAKSVGIPVLACCQLSRKTADRADERPKLSDLRESGSLEQDADVVVMLWRNPRDQQNGPNPWDNPLTLMVAKHRNGPKGDVQVRYDTRTGRFRDWVPQFSVGGAVA